MLAETCVFDKQSQEPIYCGPQRFTPPGAPLIANLRGHFAEFLNHRSPERLRLLVSPTCVSFSTVAYSINPRSFSWTSFLCMSHHHNAHGKPPWITKVDLPSFLLGSADRILTPANIFRTPSLHRWVRGTGILTCYPSSTPFGLDLGTG